MFLFASKKSLRSKTSSSSTSNLPGKNLAILLGIRAFARHEAIPEAVPLPLPALGYSVSGYESVDHGP